MSDLVPRVVWEGNLFGADPFSKINREIARRLLARKDLDLSVLSREILRPNGNYDPLLAEKIEQGPPSEADIHVFHLGAPRLVPPASGRWILFQPWELSSMYREWLLHFRHVSDAVWVYSKANFETYAADGITPDRIKIIPLGVDPSVFAPGPKSAPTWTAESNAEFKFLFVGNFVYRKGIDLLLEAYSRAFTRADSVCLVLKTSFGAFPAEFTQQRVAALRENPNAPEIMIISDLVGETAMPSLYRECDCLVHPYRGEGFGLPVAEALACGLPTIVTRGGACDDFTSDDTVFYLKKTGRKEVTMPKITNRQTWMIEPDLDELIEKLHYVRSHPDDARAKAAKGSQFVRQNFTWDKTAEAAAQAIQEQCTKPVARHVFSSQDPASSLVHAEIAIKTEDFAEASRLYLELLQKAPNRYEAPAGLGLVAWYQDRIEEAQRWFAEALRLNPTDEDTLFNFCDVSLKLNQPDVAEFALRKALSLRPSLSETARYLERLRQEVARGGGVRFERFVGMREVVKRGEKLLREGIVDEASSVFRTVLESDPEDFEALCDMGVIAFYLRDYEQAYSWFMKSLAIAPTVQDTLVNLFDTALKLRRVEEITPVLRNAVQTRPELANISAILAQIDRKGKEIYSLNNFDDFDTVEDLYRKGLGHLEAVQLAQAARDFLDVVDQKPYHDRAFNGLGVIAYYRENFQDAFALFQHAVELNPLNVDAVLNWYDAAKRLNRTQEVKPFLENIAQVDNREALQTALQEVA